MKLQTIRMRDIETNDIVLNFRSLGPVKQVDNGYNKTSVTFASRDKMTEYSHIAVRVWREGETTH